MSDEQLSLAETVTWLGLADDFVQAVGQTTDCPTEYLLMSFFTAMSILLKDVSMKFGVWDLKPNLWTMLLGYSGEGRKSTSLLSAKKLLLDLSAENSMLPSQFTPEKLLRLLADNPSGILILDEFGTLDKLMEKEYSQGLREMLTELFDTPYYSRATISGGVVRIKNPYLCVLGASTFEWFSATYSAIAGGFFPRFLVVPVFDAREELDFPKPLDQAKWNKLLMRLKNIITCKGELQFPEDSQREHIRLRRSFRSRTEKNNDPLIKPFIIRYEIAALKLAMICHFAREDWALCLNPGDITAGWKLIQWLFGKLQQSFDQTLSFNKAEKDCQLILQILRNSGPSSRSSLLRATHFPARRLTEALDTLMKSEKVECVIERGRTNTKDMFRLKGVR